MEMKDSAMIALDRPAVCRALNEPQALRGAVPGCEDLQQVDARTTTAVVVLKIGPMKARFTGEVKLSKAFPPENCVLSGEGRGGVAGFAKRSVRVRLEERGVAETVLYYDVKADIRGKIAQLGGRLIDSTAGKLAHQFFDVLGPLTAERTEASAGAAA